MNRELKRVSTLVLCMFLLLFGSTTTIQALQADDLREDSRNARTALASFSAERGSIIVEGEQVALSVPSNDQYKFQRQYPFGSLYAPVTGYNTLGQGNTGIEGAMNGELTGTANNQFLQQVEQVLTGQEPQGSSVALTIDAEAQQAAMAALDGRTGAVVALDPKTGDILALASSPTFDPNAFAVHDTRQVISTYEQMLADPTGPLHNRAIAGDLFFPGSVFKLVVVSAALESGRFTLESELPNPATLQLPGSTNEIRNSTRQACGDGGPTVSIATALTYSCNIPIAQLGQQLGFDAISEQASKFGYGKPLSMPVPVTKSVYPEVENDAQLMLSSFGQQSVRVTPLEVAMTTAAIANGGEMMRPNMVDRVIAPNLDVITEPQPETLGQAISAPNAQLMHDVMVRGVQEGYASNAAINGIVVGGKTGTAENGQNYEPYNLWFTGFGEANGRSVAVAAVVVPPRNVASDTSNEVASPIGRAVIEAVLNQ